jgi:hypothetical protein
MADGIIPPQDRHGYATRVLLEIDRFVNVVILGSKTPDTLSQRAAYAQQRGEKWACILCRVLDWIAKDHCANSIK